MWYNNISKYEAEDVGWEGSLLISCFRGNQVLKLIVPEEVADSPLWKFQENLFVVNILSTHNHRLINIRALKKHPLGWSDFGLFSFSYFQVVGVQVEKNGGG